MQPRCQTGAGRSGGGLAERVAERRQREARGEERGERGVRGERGSREGGERSDGREGRDASQERGKGKTFQARRPLHFLARPGSRVCDPHPDA